VVQLVITSQGNDEGGWLAIPIYRKMKYHVADLMWKIPEGKGRRSEGTSHCVGSRGLRFDED